MSTSRRGHWASWAAEFVMIVGSVYLAVYLQEAAQAKSDRAAARVALTQLRGELEADLRDFDRIIAKQDTLDTDYSNVGRWLAHAPAFPADSVGDAIYRLSAENPTLFARRSSWTTMVSGGQLADLGAPGLVLQLGHLYETIYPRIDYNSRYYDESLLAVIRQSPVIRWQSIGSAPLTGDTAGVARLASSLEWVHLAWNLWYRDLLVGYREDLAATIEAVDDYLSGHGAPSAAGAPGE